MELRNQRQKYTYWEYVWLLMVLLMAKPIDGQRFLDHRSACTSEEYRSNSKCTITVYCVGEISYTDSTFSSISCLSNYYGYRNYDGAYDLILDFKNMHANEIGYKQMLPNYMSRNRVKKIKLHNFEMVSIPRQIFNYDEITHFEITKSALETIDLSVFANNAHKLVTLNASNNRISLLENEEKIISSMHSLQSIDLSCNLIETVPNNYFYQFPNLSYLNLSHNYIEHIDILTFEGLSTLTTLDLSHNNLFAIDHSFVRFSDLQELMLDHNHITSLKEHNFNVMTHLHKLNLSSNNISDIEDTTFQTLGELKNIDLSHNSLSILTNEIFNKNTELEVLILSDNNITTISKGIFNAMNLTEFKINNNSLSGTIDKETFQGIHESSFDLSYNKIEILGSDVFNSFGAELQYLNLSHNSISNISSTAFLSADELITLDISYNKLSKIDGCLKNLKEVKYVNVSHNYITCISNASFEDLVSLITLDLSFNAINEIEGGSFDNLRKLEILNLCNTHITNPFTLHTLRGMISLQSLYFMNIDGTTNYEKYAFSGMTDLKIINSSSSSLMSIDYYAFNDTGSIEVMDLSHNLLKDFDVDTDSISKIVQLYLHNNRIQNITAKMFKGLNQLDKLTLAHNNIIQVHDNFIASLPKLIYLDLSFNDMMMINGSQIENHTSLYTILLKGIKTPIAFSLVSTTSLSLLDMSLSNIDEIKSCSLYQLKNLTDLNLSSNKITHIDKHSFQVMPLLFHIDLSNNLIKFIQPGSFIHTNLVNHLNLYGNELSSLQYGVFDGLQHLEFLNLSSNALNSFDVNLLHNSPTLFSIALDDNAIEIFNFDSFQGKILKDLSIGGNLINCDTFISMKNNEYEFTVTAQKYDYHSENVNGITCKTSSTKHITKTSNNTILPNITSAFDSLANAMEMFRSTIEQVANNKYSTNESKQQIDDVLTTINKLVKLYNDSQSLTNDLMKKMIDNDGKHVPIQINSESNVRNNNTPIYITLGCLILLSSVLVLLSYSYFKWKSRALEINNFASNRHLANAMEME